MTACNNPSMDKDTAATQIILYYNFLLSSSSRSPHPLTSICSSGITKYTQMYFRPMATIHLPPNRTFNKLLKCVFCTFFYILRSKTNPAVSKSSTTSAFGSGRCLLSHQHSSAHCDPMSDFRRGAEKGDCTTQMMK